MEEEQTQLTTVQPPHKKPGELTVRLITGALYVIVLIAFYVLKLFVSKLFFDALLLAFCIIGTYEMTRAFKDKLHVSQRVVVMIFSALVVLAYALSDFYYADILHVGLPSGQVVDAVGRNYAPHVTFAAFIAGVSVILGLLVFAHQKVSLESTGYAILSYIYPSCFLVVLTVCNHLERYSELAILFVFSVAPFADSLAYVFGRLLGKKLPAKMAPNVSPKKTLIGGFGGLVGGAVGAAFAFFVCFGFTKLEAIGVLSLGWDLEITPLNLLFFLGLGVLTSAFSQFGDLVESAIKRKLGIKDMGKLLPGHGGILDRIDSSLYGGLVVCFVLVLRIMFGG